MVGLTRRLLSALVSTDWLAQKLATPVYNMQVLDATWSMEKSKMKCHQEFLEAHIPTAQFFDLDKCSTRTSELDFDLPTKAHFEIYVGSLGIENNTHVVVYDNNEEYGLYSAPALWWTFRVFGHKKVSVLNGGMPAWIRDNYMVTSERQAVKPEVYNAAEPDGSLVKTFEDMMNNVEDGGTRFQLMDARPEVLFKGQVEGPIPGTKPGHIPFARNIPITMVIDNNTKLLKSPDELKTIFAFNSIDLKKPLVTSCEIGVWACILQLAAFECGKKDVANYDGSWTEWCKKAKPEHIVVD